MPDFGQAGAAAGQGFALGGPAGAAALGLGTLFGGLFGGQPQLPKELKRLYNFQYGLADQMRRFSQSVPLSDPGEQAALASQRGLEGQQFNQGSQNLLGQLNLNNATPGGIGDFLTNRQNQFQAQSGALDAQHLLAALAARRQGVLQASQIAGGASAAARDYQQPPDLAGLFGNISRLWAQNQGQGGFGGGQGAGGAAGIVGALPGGAAGGGGLLPDDTEWQRRRSGALGGNPYTELLGGLR